MVKNVARCWQNVVHMLLQIPHTLFRFVNFTQNILFDFANDVVLNFIQRETFSEVFQYKDLDIEDKLIRAQKEDIRLNNGSLTINEVRSSYGEPPVPWGNQPLTNHNSLISESLMDIEHNKKELVLNDY